MCDTMVALPSITKGGMMLFAKNSDRSPNEPHLVVRYGAKKYDLTSNPQLKLTYMTIPQIEKTNEVVLMKPNWIWGAEMGYNEYGLNIGNEAVFTREKKGEKSLIGMDMLRLALERTTKAKEALELIIGLLELYGQGGNCGYDHEFHYHNSFLIADKEEAFVLETAGKYYAAKKVKDFYAISNCLSIENDFDLIHPDAINNAIKTHRCNLVTEFSFAKCYSDKLFTYFAKAKNRRCNAMKVMESEKGNITVDTMMKILRSHSPSYKENKNSVSSICMHAGGLIGDQTTGSYVASITDNTYYVTGSSLPCQSIFKPLMLTKNMPIPYEDEKKAEEYWLRYERLQRFVLSGQIDKNAYDSDRENFEKAQLLLFKESKDKESTILKIWESEQAFINKYLQPLEKARHTFKKGSLLYRRYWKKKTKLLSSKNKD